MIPLKRRRVSKGAQGSGHCHEGAPRMLTYRHAFVHAINTYKLVLIPRAGAWLQEVEQWQPESKCPSDRRDNLAGTLLTQFLAEGGRSKIYWA